MRHGIKRALALVTALALLAGLLASCGEKLEATSMRLKRTQGAVGVADSGGKTLEPREDLGLYDGYQVGTQADSYAWIDLDDVKLTKMDQDSEIAITKEDKHLSIDVKSGSLFFNVTQPLAEDETMDIHTSTMVVGIRGTCGWVRGYESTGWMELYLLEGTVECSAGGGTATVTAGEMASMSEDGDIVVVPFPESSVPDFVLDEVKEDETLCAAVAAATGLDLQNWDPQAEAAALAAALAGAGYYGDPAACTMTRAQAGQLIQALEDRLAEYKAVEDIAWEHGGGPVDKSSALGRVALFDVGGGVPAFLFAAGAWDSSNPTYYDTDSLAYSRWSVWQYADGQYIHFEPGDMNLSLFEGNLTTSVAHGDPAWDIYAYSFENGRIPEQYTSYFSGMNDYVDGESKDFNYIDEQPVTQEEADQWRARWQSGYPLASVSSGPGMFDAYHSGLVPMEDVIAALRPYAGAKDAAPGTSGGEGGAPEDAYEINGTLELAEGSTRLRNEEIYQDVVVREGQFLTCKETTIYGSVYVEYGGHVTLNESTIRGSVHVEFGGGIYLDDSTVCGDIYGDGGGVDLTGSTAEGDIYVRNAQLDDGTNGIGDFHMFESKAAKNINIVGLGAAIDNSTVDGYIDVGSSADYGEYGAEYGVADIRQSTVNGQWHEHTAVVYEFHEGYWYDDDDVTVIMGRTP